MQLEVYDREIGRTDTAVKTARPESTGTLGPQAKTKFGNDLMAVGDQISKRINAANDITEYSAMMSEAKKRASSYYAERSRDMENIDTLSEDVNSYLSDLKETALDGIFSPEQKARVAQGFDSLSESYHSKAVGDTYTYKVKNAQSLHRHTRAIMSQEAAAGSDDEMRTVFQNYAEQTRALAALGVFDPDEAEKDIIDFYGDGARGKVRRLMNEDPRTALSYMLDQQTLGKLLTPEHRENLMAQAQRLIDAQERAAEAAERRKEAAEAKELKLWQENNYITSYNDILRGDMTLARLQEMGETGLLKGTDYSNLHSMMLKRTKEFTGDPKIYNEMRDRAWMGELQLRDVQVALIDEQINWDHAQQLTTEIEQGASVVQSENYKTYLTALKTSLGWSPAGPISIDNSALIAQATIDFRRRVIQGESIDDVYMDISERYRKIGTNVFPKPRYQSIEEAKQNLRPGPELDREIRSIEYHQRIAREAAAYEKSRQNGNN